MEKILLLSTIIGLIILCPFLKQDWSSPAVLNLLWNSVFIVLAVVFFGGMIEWKYGGIIWIILSCVIFLLGQVIGERVSSERRVLVVNDGKIITNLVPLGVVLLIMIGMLNPIIYLREFGYSIMDIFNINALLAVNTEIAADRYYGDGFESGIIVVIGAISYCVALCGGYMFGYCKKLISKTCMILSIVPMVFLTIITNAKVGTIAVVFLWIIGWIISYVERNKRGIEISKKLFFVLCVVGIAFLFVLYVSMMLRIGSIDMETKLIVDKKMQEYALGHIEAFSEWFSMQDYFQYDLGSNTFMVFARYLGITERIQGVYDALPGVASNIFTQNRGIIHDFGVVGGLVYWALLGVLAGRSYKDTKQYGREKKISMFVLAGIYFSIFYGFIISPWIYTSYVVAIVGFFLFLCLIDIIKVSVVRGTRV